MPVVPAETHAQPSEQQLGLYRAMLEQAASGGGVLMGEMVAAGQLALKTGAAAAREMRQHAALTEAARQLGEQASNLCAAYPKALLGAFSRPAPASPATAALNFDLQFDQLELMDEDEVMTRVWLARTQQEVLLAAQTRLVELNTLMGSTFGLTSLCPENNPLRPESYVDALKAVVEHIPLPASTRLQ